MDKSSSSKIDEINKIVEKSGNVFHYKVVRFLREKEWKVTVSPYYVDEYTSKPREIDIVAENFSPILDWSGIPLGYTKVKLFIECKYVNNPIVLWFDEKDQKKAVKRICLDTDLEEPEKNTRIEQHHYYSEKSVAKISSSQGNSDEGDVFYKAISQSLGALIYYKQNGISHVIDEYSKQRKVFGTVTYPIIVCNSFEKLYKVDTLSLVDEPPQKILDSFQFEVNYAYSSSGGDRKMTSEYFLVDVIDFSRFDSVLEMFNKELGLIGEIFFKKSS